MSSPPSDRTLHPLSFLFELASHTRQLLVPGLLVLIAGARGADSWQIYLMLLFVPQALLAIGRALVFRYNVDGDELEIRSGLIFKQQRHIPFARIQNIDAIQNIFHRVVGVVDVRLETAGGEEPEAHLKVLTVAAFEELRSRVAAARHDVPAQTASAAIDESGVASDSAPAEAAVDLLRLSTRDLIVCGLIQGRAIIVIGTLFGLLWEAGMMERVGGGMFGAPLQTGGVIRQLVLAFFGRGVPSFGRIVMLIAAFIALVLVTRLFSIGWALVRLHGYRLRRIGNDLRIDFGLLTRVAATIPIRRIQSVTVLEGPLHRPFGRVSIHVDTAGGESGQEVQLQRQWLAPVVDRHQVASLLRQILPSIGGDDVDWRPVDPRGVRRARVEWIITAAGISLLFVGILRWWTPIVFVIVMAIGELNARRSVRALGWSLGETGIFFRSGWVWRRRTVAPVAKIQAVSVLESPFDRRLAMARVAVDTAGTSGDEHRILVPYLPRSTADALAAELAARAGQTTFRW
jgi:putative membrane protein